MKKIKPSFFSSVKIALKSFFVEENADDFFVNLFAIAIYTDGKILDEEIETSIFIISEITEGDLAELKEQLLIKLNSYQKDHRTFVIDMDELVQFIIKNEREDLGELLIDIYVADREISKEEKAIITRLEEKFTFEKRRNVYEKK